MVASSPLSWVQIPALPAQGISPEIDAVRERHSVLDASDKTSYARWMQHMIRMGVCTLTDLRTAFSSHYPYTALQALYNQTIRQLTDRMNDTVKQHYLPSHDADEWDSCVYLGLNTINHYGDGDHLTISLSSGYYFNIDTLMRQPRRISKVLLTVFELIDRLLTPCLTPTDLWNGSFNSYLEEKEQEWTEIRKLINLHGIDEAKRHIDANDDFYFFSDCHLEDEMAEFSLQMNGYKGFDDLTPVNLKRAFLQRLQQRIHALQASENDNLWLEYAHYAVDIILDCFPTDRMLTKMQATHSLLERYLEADNCTDLGFGVFLSTDSPCEETRLQDCLDQMGETGEYPAGSIPLNNIASTALCRRIDYLAHGFGLLYRANDVNTAIKGEWHDI